MKTLYALREEYGGELCRRCINEVRGVRIERTDCWYADTPYPTRCARCGELRNIVTALRLSGRLKLWRK